MEEKQSIFKKIHTDRFKWHDLIIITVFLTLFLMIVGENIGYLITEELLGRLKENDETGFASISLEYFNFIGLWVAYTLYCLIVKKNRPILKTITTKAPGNTIKMLLIGLLVGFGTNLFCAICAMINKDIHIYYDSFPVLQLIVIFICVFIQSSAEELICRGFMYYRLRKAYRHPAVAIIVNSAFFASIHIFNPGVSKLAILDIFFTGIFFSLVVYYTDSLWCAFAIHAAWNYMQNIILGLPNSGLVSPYSIFKLDASTAKDSFAYSVAFGLEGTILAVSVMALCCIAVFLIYHKKNVQHYDPWN